MSRAALYQRLLKQAAKELRCKVTDEKVKNVAVLRLAREVISTKLVAGKDIDPNALRWLSEQLDKYAPNVQPQKVEVNIQPVTLCARCKAVVEDEPPPTPTPRSPVSPPTATRATEKPFASKPAAEKVVPIKRQPPSMHDGCWHTAAPLAGGHGLAGLTANEAHVRTYRANRQNPFASDDPDLSYSSPPTPPSDPKGAA
jgi:hypothetical protein